MINDQEIELYILRTDNSRGKKPLV